VPWHRRVPEPLSWGKDFVLTVAWGLTMRGPIDVFIGVDPLNAAAGLLLRRLGKADKVVFWTIDYVPDRFPSRIMNRIYHSFDRLCVTRCDVTWNVSPRMEPARRQRGVTGRQRVVEVGADYTGSTGPWDHHRIVFVGHLLEKQGVQLALGALPTVREAVPDAHLLVIGDGPYRDELERLAHEAGVDGAVEFAGYVECHEEVERLIAESAVGLATYDPSIASFTIYADPGKVKNYLAAGIPVITTDVVHSAAELAYQGAAIVVPYDESSLAETLVTVLIDRQHQELLRSAARVVGARSDWTAVLDRAFADLPS
jgi:glycosyltransferase involved in cell wall biosynthesis